MSIKISSYNEGTDYEKAVFSVKSGNVCYKICLPDYKVDYIQKNIHSLGEPYESEMLHALSLGLKENDLVLDIGANIGNHTLFFANVCGCKVKAFEPNPLLCDPLFFSIEKSDLLDKVELFKAGVGAKETKASFKVLNESNLGAQSLELNDSKEANIDVVKLDDQVFETPVSLIKIDVEGMELDVLKGGAELIRRDKPLLAVESTNIEEYLSLQSFMKENGYIYCCSFNGTPTHIYLHHEKVAYSPWLELFGRGGEVFHQMRHFHRKLKKAVSVLRQNRIKGW